MVCTDMIRRMMGKGELGKPECEAVMELLDGIDLQYEMALKNIRRLEAEVEECRKIMARMVDKGGGK